MNWNFVAPLCLGWRIFIGDLYIGAPLPCQVKRQTRLNYQSIYI